MHLEMVPMNLAKLWEEGLPDDMYMINVAETTNVLEFKKWTNGTFQVYLCYPTLDKKRLLGQCVSYSDCCRLVEMAFLGKRKF